MKQQKKKRNERKEVALVYEPIIGVSRWNLCQHLAKLVYHSAEHDQKIIAEIEAVQEAWNF